MTDILASYAAAPIQNFMAYFEGVLMINYLVL